MITIRQQNNLFAFIEGALSDDLITSLDKATSFYVKGYRYSPRYRAKQWDGKKHFLTRPNNKLPIGLLSIVEKVLKKHKVSYQVVGESVPDIEYNDQPFANGDSLRPHQEEAVRLALQAKRGVLNLATNAGKTHTYAGLIRSINQPTLFLTANTKDSFLQSQANLEKLLGQRVGLIGDGRCNICDITIGLPKSIINNKDFLKKYYFPKIKCLIVNECHHLGAKTYYDVAMMVNAPYRFGGSGTPAGRSDGKDLFVQAALGPEIVRVSNSDLKAQNLSSDCFIQLFTITEPDWNNVQADYSDVYENLIVCNEKRNRIICNAVTEYILNKQILIIVRRILHGEILQERLQTMGIAATYITGKEDSEVRKNVLQTFREGGIECLIASTILDEDVDLPSIGVLILAVGGKSHIKTIQRVGRGLRKSGDSKLIVLDFIDYGHKFTLEHSLQRMKDYRAEGCFELELVC